MKEGRRILLSRVWLGVLALLLVCHAGLFLRTQSERVGGSLSAYAEETALGRHSVRPPNGDRRGTAGQEPSICGKLECRLGIQLQ